MKRMALAALAVLAVATMLFATEDNDTQTANTKIQFSPAYNVVICEEEIPLMGFDIGGAYNFSNNFYGGLTYGMSFYREEGTTEYTSSSNTFSGNVTSNYNYTTTSKYATTVYDVGVLFGGKYVQLNPSFVLLKTTGERDCDYASSNSNDYLTTYEAVAGGFGIGIKTNIPIHDNLMWTITPKMSWLNEISSRSTDTRDNSDNSNYSSDNYEYEYSAMSAFKISTGITFNF